MPEHQIEGSRAVEIAESIAAGIESGALAPGTGLPTVRALAQELRVSPSTVSSAYRSLQGRGLLVAGRRRGTQVSSRPPIPSARETALAPGLRDLASGNPDPALLPPLGRALATLDTTRVLYGGPLVDAELARRARQAFRADGIPSRSVCVVGGALDGLERVLAAHLQPGERVAIEDPAFVGVRDLLAALALVPVPVAIDDSGLLPDSLDDALRRGPSALILTPRAQNPTGACLDAKRVRELRSVLAHYPDVLVCEDDHAGAVAGADTRTLATDRAGARFAVVRSFAKALGPDLRIALLAADERTIARVEGRQRLGMRWVSHLLQRLALALWRDRDVQRGLARAAGVYAARREALVDALSGHGIEARGRSGLNVWVPVPDEGSAVSRLANAGFGVVAGERFRLVSPPAIRISIATLRTEEAEGVARAVHDALGPSPRSTPS